MKRLQFRKHEEVFATRSEALSFMNAIVDKSNVASTAFGESLYAEPMVLKYLDGDGNIQIILAVGVDGEHTPYHIIDTRAIDENIIAEAVRAMAAEDNLARDIANEIARATASEGDITANLTAEISRAIAAEEDLQSQINNNEITVSTVIPTEANVREEYVVKNAKGEILGEHIKVYKDSALVGAVIDHDGATSVEMIDGGFAFSYKEGADTERECLYLIYRLDPEEKLQFVKIDFEDFFKESEVGNGLTIDGHKMAIKIDASDEGYLKVDNSGLRTEGINNAISEASDTTLSNAKIYTDESVESLEKTVKANKLYSKDVKLETSESGTMLTLLVDGKTIGKEDAVKYEDGLPRLHTLIKLVDTTTSLPSGSLIKNSFELQDADGNKIGDTINLSKEGSLYKVKSGHVNDTVATDGTIIEGDGDASLNFVYRKPDGSFDIATITISQFFTEAETAINTKIDELELSIATDMENAKSEAISGANAYTNTKVADITAGIDTLTNTINTAIEGMTALVNEAVATESEARASADALLQTKEAAASNFISAITFAEAKAVDAKNAAIASAKVYADSAIEISKKVIDVKYDSGNKIVSLVFNDGTISSGFDATDFIVDGMLKDVVLSGDVLTFIWNTDGADKELAVALTDFVNIYTSANDFIKINGYEITARVDGADGYANTLASTDFVKSHTIEKINEFSAVTSSVFNDFTDRVNTKVNENTEAIAILNADALTTGSMSFIANDKIAHAIITDGVVSPSDATLSHSLARMVDGFSGNTKYYISSKATDMYYVKPDGHTVELNKYIKNLEDRITSLETNMEAAIYETVKNYLVGIDKEISVFEKDGKLNIGFSDNAIFGGNE